MYCAVARQDVYKFSSAYGFLQRLVVVLVRLARGLGETECGSDGMSCASISVEIRLDITRF
jgi:hypothetical protein